VAHFPGPRECSYDEGMVAGVVFGVSVFAVTVPVSAVTVAVSVCAQCFAPPGSRGGRYENDFPTSFSSMLHSGTSRRYA
jgi:hypothetical protein